MSTDSETQATLIRVLDYQQALAGFSRAALELLPPDRLMQHACAQVSRVTHIRHTKVMRYRPDHGDLLLVAGVGWKPGVIGVTTLGADSASPPGRTIQTAAPVVIEDLPNQSEYRISPLLRDHGIVSVLNVPVMLDVQTWGVLEVDADKPRAFDDRDVAFLTTVAHIIGITLSRYAAEERALELTQLQARSESVWKTMVGELQHRTKNNLQTIMSFISIQARQADTPASGSAFDSVLKRVHAIALAHDQLSIHEGSSKVDFGDYLNSLCANIVPRHEGQRVTVDTSRPTLPLDRAVPAGLIVNELVTNAFKYAFDDGKEGLVRVTFTIDAENGEACITVEDNGKGMGPHRAGGLGLTLVDAFAQQLAGRVQRDQPKQGTRTRVFFPLVS